MLKRKVKKYLSLYSTQCNVRSATPAGIFLGGGIWKTSLGETDLKEISYFSVKKIRFLIKDEVSQTVTNGGVLIDLNALGHVGVMADDEVGAAVDDPLKSSGNIRRRKRYVFHAAVANNDDNVNGCFDLMDNGGDLVNFPAEHTGSSYGCREVFAFTKTDHAIRILWRSIIKGLFAAFTDIPAPTVLMPLSFNSSRVSANASTPWSKT
jgi:hypothetical protein